MIAIKACIGGQKVEAQPYRAELNLVKAVEIYDQEDSYYRPRGIHRYVITAWMNRCEDGHDGYGPRREYVIQQHHEGLLALYGDGD
jgi:hypothetical protein